MDEALSIKAVSQLSGVSLHTMRAWERRYGAIEPARTPTGRRVYQSSDVEKLRLLNRLLQGGYSIGGIARLGAKELQKLAAGLPEPKISSAPRFAVAGQEPDADPFIRAMLSALKSYRLDRLDAELSRARMVFTIRTLILEVVGSLMARVGEQVQNKKLGLAQEHAVSALLRGHLGHIFQSCGAASPGANLRVVLSTPAGDLHEFGILMSAILCASRGFTASYLGPNLPPEDLAVAARAIKARWVIVGTTPLPPGTMVAPLKTYLRKLERALKPGAEIWVGGAGSAMLDKNTRAQPIATLAELDARLARISGQAWAAAV